ncbi:hypothetical protein RUM43_014245 [Polyplax serrata]|uniref:Peptidase S1 domain-containing protein n=1 Tax=Polyplax serrata TaxID=468196 RepID=A0AAN8PGL6_POLSC
MSDCIYSHIRNMFSAFMKDCGRSFVGHRQPRNTTYVSEGRIINGKKSAQGAWPWQVSLQLLHPKFGLIGHWCGAVLIQPLWIITAAHCIHNDLFNLPLATLWTAVLGDWNRDIEENTEIRVPIDRIIVHEKYNNYENDIAIMKLSKAVHIRSVCLPDDWTNYNVFQDEMEKKNFFTNENGKNTPSTTHRKGRRISSNKNSSSNNKIDKYQSNYINMLAVEIQKISEKFKNQRKNVHKGNYKSRAQPKCVVTGWGRDKTQGPMTSTLLQATVPLHDNSLCQAKYGSSVPIRTGHLCAGHLDGTTGTCVGDSGGPLQCSLNDGRWVLTGITSFGSGCAKPGYPDVYTRLAFYVPWIYQQINKYKD